MTEVGYSRSQLYSWLQGVEEREQCAPKGVSEEVARHAVEVVTTYPYMGAPKGQMYMIYHRLGYIPQHVYKVLKKIVKILVFQQVSSRRLLPAKTSYTHERAQAVGQIWAEDFTSLTVSGFTFYVSLIIDVFSTFILGHGLSICATSELVEEPIPEALDNNNNHGPERFLLSDNGKQYISKDHSDHLAGLDIVQKRIPSCRPEYNGSVECGMKEFKQVFYNVWAENDTKSAYKRKELFDSVCEAVEDTVCRLNHEIPRPCLEGVTPYDVHCGLEVKRKEANQKYVDLEKQRKEVKPWSKNYWQMAKEVLTKQNLTDLELLTKFCFFLKRPLRKLPQLMEEVHW